MIRFYTLDELYTNNDINSDFLCSFNHLTDSAKKIVLAKNKTLKDFIELHPKLFFAENNTSSDVAAAIDNSRSVGKEENLVCYENALPQEVGEILSEPATKRKSVQIPSETDYDKLDFSKDVVYVNKLFLRLITNRKNKCPKHDKQKLKKINVVIKNKGRNEKLSLWACSTCKRFYTWAKMDDITKLNKLKIEFECIDWKYDK